MTDRNELQIAYHSRAEMLERAVFQFLHGRKLKGSADLLRAAVALGEARQALVDHVVAANTAPAEAEAEEPFAITEEPAPGFEVTP